MTQARPVSIYSRNRSALFPLGLLGLQNAQAQAGSLPENKPNKEESKIETKQRSSLDGIVPTMAEATEQANAFSFTPKSV